MSVEYPTSKQIVVVPFGEDLYAMRLLLITCLLFQFSFDTAFAQELKIENNITYTEQSDDTLRQLNLILPQGYENPPLLLWIGGGAWAYVNRHKEMDLCRKVAEAGIAVASVGHRLSPALLNEPVREEGVEHPAHVKDIAQAFKWLHDHAADFGYDQGKIFVGGFSSGAHLSSLLALDKRYLAAEGLAIRDIAGAIPIGGAFDVPHYRDFLVNANADYLWQHIEPVFGKDSTQHIDASPINYLENLEVPFLIMSDNNTYKYNKVFEDMLKETEFQDFDVVHVGALSHGDLWKNLAADQSMYRSMLTSFILAN